MSGIASPCFVTFCFSLRSDVLSVFTLAQTGTEYIAPMRGENEMKFKYVSVVSWNMFCCFYVLLLCRYFYPYFSV